MNALLIDDDVRALRIAAWTKAMLDVPKVDVEDAWDEETQYALPAVLPRIKVRPSAVLVQEAVERHLAVSGLSPKAVVMHPLRLLSLARYDTELYFCGETIVALRTRSGLDVDEMYGVCPVVTAPIEAISVDA